MEEIHELFLYGDSDKLADPTTYEEAICDIDASKWQIVIDSEIQSMYSNQVWVLVDQHEEIVLIECKWIFKQKIGANGQVFTYKTLIPLKEISYGLCIINFAACI